jgi:spore maturation protein SpmA
MMQDFLKSAETATEIVIGLMGMMCFWLGISRIMDSAGLTEKLAALLTPLFRVIMPEIPKGHPATGSIAMNMAANMLGLDNAATPLGLRAMKELETLNKTPGTATNAEIMFLVINTSSVTIFPVSVFLYRSKFGAADPVDVFLPILIATSCSTLAGFLAAALFQKINILKLPVLLALGGLLGLVAGVFVWSLYAGASLASQASYAANGCVLLFIGGLLAYSLLKRVPVYEEFIKGAKEGFRVCIDILPYLVAMLTAIAFLRAGGVLPLLLSGIKKIFEGLGTGTDFVDALPVALMHPFSGSGARALMLDTFNTFGVDSLTGHIAAVMQGSTETTFYVLAVYFGSVGITRVRHAVTCGLIADFTAMVAAIVAGMLFFG